MDRRRLLKGAAGGALLLTAGGRQPRPALAQESGPITVKDALGEVTLDRPAERVVALEWVYAEDLLGIGVQPLGVADIEGYHTWVEIPPELSADATDVGTRQEPSLESITALTPDLIVGPLFRLETVRDSLDAIAPTLLFNPYPTDGTLTQYQEMLDTTLTLATAVGKADAAEALLAQMADAFANAKARLVDAGLADAPYVLVQAYTYQNSPQLRLFLDNAMAVEELAQVGLRNAYAGEPDQYGFNTVGVEALVAVQDANFIYIVQDNDDVFANQLKENPVWTGLNFVKEGRGFRLAGDTWTFGGPLSAITFVDRVVAAMTGEPAATPTA